jgi:6-phospho-beta-glucosidase
MTAMSRMKIAVIGGGSTYTPELVSCLLRKGLGVGELALHDIDAERLDVVGGLAGRMLAREGFTGELLLTHDLDEALDGADFVLLQIRVGGQAARLLDETIPLEMGCIGQETTGAGGFAKALRTVPVVLAIAARVAERAAPGAWIIDFTNPVGIVTRALLDAGPRAIGLCNVAITFQRIFARLLAVDPARVEVDQVGLNHLTWVRAVRVDEVDVLPGLLSEHGDELAVEVHLPRRLLDELGVLPSYYLRYYYATREVLAEQLAGVPRAQVVAETERELLRLYEDPRLAEKPELLETRGGAFYSEAAAALMASLAGDDGRVHVVNVRNQGTIAGLADDDVVEAPARIGSAGASPVAQAPLAPELLGLVQRVAAYERLAVKAAVGGDRTAAFKALLAHPLVGQAAPAEQLLEGLLRAGAAYLPQFAPEAAAGEPPREAGLPEGTGQEAGLQEAAPTEAAP